MLVKSIFDVVGQTPLLEIDPKVHGLKNIRLYAKLEHLNPFGSLKDRPAWHILKDDIESIAANKQTVIDSSSGNMAKAMQVICSMNGVPLRIVTSRIQVKEVKQILQLLGAEVAEFPGMSSCPDPTDPNNPLAQIEREMAAQPGKFFFTTQFTNEKNAAAHKTRTGAEILADLAGEPVHFLAGGMGTTGSSRGAGELLQSVNPDLVTVGVVAKRGQVIPGIRNADEMKEVGLFQKDFYSEIIEISVDDAIDGVVTLARQVGVLCGPSSGAAYKAALRHLAKVDATLTEKKNAVFIVNDRVEWYLSYLQKHRPELFALPVRSESARAVSEEEIAKAPTVTVTEARDWLAKSPSGIIVDLRGYLAFKSGHIAGSINIPQEQFEEMCEYGSPFSSEFRVLIVCPVGEQSKRFGAFLSQRGITAASLTGGFIAWRDAGQPIQKASKKPRT